MRHSVECPKYDADCCWALLCLQGSALGVYYKSVDATALLDRWGKNRDFKRNKCRRLQFCLRFLS